MRRLSRTCILVLLGLALGMPTSGELWAQTETYVLEGISWSFKRESPPWNPSDIVAEGKTITIPNPQIDGQVTVSLELPDSVTKGQEFTTVFTVTAAATPTPWDISILGWGGSEDSQVVDINARPRGPVNLSLRATWRPNPDGSWTVDAIASPGFRDGTTTKTFRREGEPPGYPLFRVRFDSSGVKVISAFVRWRFVKGELPTIPPPTTTTTIPTGTPTVDLDSPKTELRAGDSFILDLILKSGGSRSGIDLFFSIEIKGIIPVTIFLGPTLEFVPSQIPVVTNLTPIDASVRIFGPAPSILVPSIFGEFIIPPNVIGSFSFVAEVVDSRTKASISSARVTIILI